MPPEPQSPLGVLHSPQPTRDSMHLKLAIAAIVIVALLAAAYYLWMYAPVTGSVTLLVRDAESGERMVYTYALSSGSFGANDADPNLVNGSSALLYDQGDGSVIGLAPAGVVHADAENRTTVLVASPVPPTARTALALWGRGGRIAWTSPVDGSVQVFDRSPRGTYVPSYLNTELSANSLGFTEDGSILVAAHMVGDETELYAIIIETGMVRKISTIDGLVSIIHTP